MSSPMISTANQTAATAATTPSSAHPLTAGAVAASNKGEATVATTINSLADLKKKSPELYQKMMESLAMSVCNDMKAHQDRLKSMMRKASSG